jgi:HD-like signal output (HDOD) protein
MLDHNNLIRCAYQLQPLPQSCSRLAALLAQEDSDMRVISEVIAFDPVLTGKLLRMANSAASSTRGTIATVKQAVIRLGAGTVLSLVVGACAQPIMEGSVPGYALSAQQLWQHSLTAALAAEVAQEFCADSLSPLCFTAALLHDMGKLVLGRFLTPELLALCKRAALEGGLMAFEAESEILSVHHGEVGGIIAQHWNLPAGIVNGVTHHHTPEEGQETICFVTHLANAVAMHVEGSSDWTERERKAVDVTRKRLGLNEADFEQVCEVTKRRLDEVNRRYS